MRIGTREYLPQKLLPLQHKPGAHLALTIGPQVWPVCEILAGPDGRAGDFLLVEQSPKPF